MNPDQYYPWIDVAIIFGGMAVLGTWAVIGHYRDLRKARSIQRQINASVSHAKRSLKHF